MSNVICVDFAKRRAVKRREQNLTRLDNFLGHNLSIFTIGMACGALGLLGIACIFAKW